MLYPFSPVVPTRSLPAVGRAARLALRVACGVLGVLLALTVSGGDALGAERCDSTGIPTTTVYLPNITKTLGGPAGWVTPIYIQNSGAVQTTVELSFFRFRDGALVACHKTSDIAPGTSLVDNPNEDVDLPDDTQFSVVVKSFGAPVVAIVNQLQGSGPTQQALSYSGFTQGDQTVYLPNVTRRFFGYDVPFIVQDVGPAVANVTAKFISFDGTSTYTRAFTVAPGRSFVIDPDFEPASTGAPNSGLRDGTQYAVTLTSTQPIAVVVNAHSETGSPVAFSHNGIGRGATVLFAPYAAKAVPPGSSFSPVVVQNLGATPTDAQLLFTSSSPLVAPQTFTLKAIPAGGAQAFDPRFTLGTTTPCVVASATCLGIGEFSLRITAANPVAAVVLPNSATTAGGYLASSQLTERTLVPTAFRRIGGANGWGTRIVSYSGAPAQLTARVFAIPSGDLKATFPVPIGPTGWASFDLNTVAGLADNAQYAVTVDGGGTPLTTIAIERASTGGDALMVFEAFGGSALGSALAPASLRVTAPPTTIPTTWTHSFAASVKDQFGGAMQEPLVTYTLAPATLGAVSQTGVFTAGAGPGSGTLTVTAGLVSTRVPINVSLPQTVTLQGTTFWKFSMGLADVYTETSVGLNNTQGIVAQVDGDMAQIQTTYTRPYARRPSVYTLANSANFQKAVRDIGLTTTATPSWAAGLCICFGPRADWVFVNWQEQSRSQPTVTRHELTHVMQHQLAPFTFLTPTWFDEGNARLEEFTLPDTQWWAAVQKYRSASMSWNNATFTLFELISGSAWSARNELDASYAYALATQAVQFLRNDIGMAGELLIFDLMLSGESFYDSYDIAAGRSYLEFQQEFTTRVRALAPQGPAIVTEVDGPEGASSFTFIVYGLPPNTQFTLSIAGTAQSVPVTRTADAYGFFYSYLDEQWRPGPYSISVTWSGGTVTGTGTKLR
jgi:hypothetical protein